MDEEAKIYFPVAGECYPLKMVADVMFKEEMLGPTVCILPQTNTVFSPFDGVVSAFYDSMHAIGITRDDGLQVLIHIGIDTGMLNGEGFFSKIKQGDHVCCHDPLICFDKNYLEQRGYDCFVFFVLLNGEQYQMEYVKPMDYFTEKDVLAYAKGL